MRRVYISLWPVTHETQSELLQFVSAVEFFGSNDNLPGSLPGEHFLAGFASAAAVCRPEQVPHLCNIDRVAFARQGSYGAQFAQDVRTTSVARLPLLRTG